MVHYQPGPPPKHVVSVATRDGAIDVEELTDDGALCRTQSRDGAVLVGSTREALAAACGLRIDDPWVCAVSDALARERGWKAWGSGWGRAHGLEIKVGDGVMFHVTGTANRASIERWGLDWDQMGAVPGIAGSPTPEAPGIYPQEDEDDDFFIGMARHAVEVWEVDVTGLWLELRPGGWWFTSERIPARHVRLLPPRHLAT